MSIENVPLDVFTTVIDDVLTASTWSEGLELRKVNKFFDHHVQAAYFDRLSIPINEEPRSSWSSHAMRGQHLYRYLKGQIRSLRPKHPLYVNLEGAVDVLDAVEGFRWEVPTWRDRPEGVLEFPSQLVDKSKKDHILTLVTLTVLNFFADEINMLSLFELTLFNNQASPECWAIMTAIYLNDRATVETLLDQLPANHMRTFHLSDPLRLAIKARKQEMARLLLASGADVNAYPTYYDPYMGYSMVLDEACRGEDLDMVQLVLEPQYCIESFTEEYEKSIKLMVEKYKALEVQASGDYDPHLNRRLKTCRLIVAALIDGAFPDLREPLLHFLVNRSIRNHTDGLVRLAIQLGFDVNYTIPQHQTPLVQASARGDEKIGATLIAHGARTKYCQDHDAIAEACRGGHVYALDVLLSRATSIDEYGHARAGSILVIMLGSIVYTSETCLLCMQCFFAHGLDPNAGTWGFRALNISLRRRRPDITRYLLDKGVRPPMIGEEREFEENSTFL
ncbi:hypothetical protein ABEF91_005501 [Exophiala dermatitidis]